MKRKTKPRKESIAYASRDLKVNKLHAKLDKVFKTTVKRPEWDPLHGWAS